MTSENWKRKERWSIIANKREIEKVKAGTGDPVYRGPEDPWYMTWTCTMSRHLGEYRSLSFGPQIRTSRKVLLNDGQLSKEERIPDFTISRSLIKEKVVPNWGKLFFCHSAKVVGLVEIKPPPGFEGDQEVEAAINEARHDLRQQLAVLFTGDDLQQEVIGMSIAGDWWSWDIYKRKEFVLLSKNADTTYRPGKFLVSGTSSRRRAGLHYQLGTPESDVAMNKMLIKIAQLKGCEDFIGSPF